MSIRKLNMQEIKFTIPHFGYRIETRKRMVNRDEAPEVLTASMQQKISHAIRNDDDITIIKHVVVCSSCGQGVPAYGKYIEQQKESFKIQTKPEIEEWSTRQMSLFGEPPKIMHFNNPISEIAHFVCPHCKAGLTQDKHEIRVIIRTNRKKIKIMRALRLEEYFSVKWIDRLDISEFYIYETITFNLRNGHTYVSLENKEGGKYAVRDISNADITKLSEDPIFKLIQIYKPVYSKLKRFFRNFWNNTLPFSPLEFDPEKYILLTKFVGFNRDFYKALPFSNTGNCIERSFAGIAKQLHNANDVPALFESLQLPNIKTVRKIVFSNPALLFYQKELEAVWQILNNPDIFRTFLESKYLYRELSVLHKYPSMAVFYMELVTVIGQRALCNCLSKGNNSLHSYALKYLLLNDYEKKIEKKRWTSSFLSKMDNRKKTNLGSLFSVPVPPSNEVADTLDCRIDGYSFVRLCNSKEYVAAGNELQNCLKNWEWFDGNVYGVLRGGRYVAAIEINDGVILQAHTYRNGEINKDRALFSAFCQWKERNELTEDDDSEVEDGE